MTQTSFRDVEQLSALLDENLNSADVARLQTRLESDPQLRATYEQLLQARTLLRRLPQRRAPRNFTLKPSAARVRPPLPRFFSTFRLASALAGLLLIFSLATNAALPHLAGMANEIPLYAYGIGGASEAEERATISEDTPQKMPMFATAPEEPAEQPEAPLAPAVEAPLVEQPEVTGLAIEEPLIAEEIPPTQAEAYPASPPVPAWALIPLALFAILSGGLAFFLRWQSERRWKTNRKTKTE